MLFHAIAPGLITFLICLGLWTDFGVRGPNPRIKRGFGRGPHAHLLAV